MIRQIFGWSISKIMTMFRQHDRDSIDSQAEKWLCILQMDEPVDVNAFMTWVKQSPLHLRAILLADMRFELLRRVLLSRVRRDS